MKKLKAILVLSFSLFFSFHLQAQDRQDNREISFSQECAPADSRVTLSLAGDILIHDALYQNVMQTGESFYPLFKKVQPLFARADFSYANLEGPVAMGI